MDKAGNRDNRDSLVTMVAFPPEPDSLSNYIHRPDERDSIKVKEAEAVFTDKIKLDHITRGFDSLQIRVEIAYPLTSDSIKYLVIKKTNSGWNGEVRKVTGEYKGDTVYYTVISKRRNIVPRNGWEGLVKKVMENKLLHQPRTRHPDDSNSLHSPTTISFEVATEGSYRKFRYLIPGLYEENSWKRKELEDILQLLDGELDFKIYSSVAAGIDSVSWNEILRQTRKGAKRPILPSGPVGIGIVIVGEIFLGINDYAVW
ncbi:MAG: hypothetical protein ABWZ25_11370 [Chitinophagaceae bacterium]